MRQTAGRKAEGAAASDQAPVMARRGAPRTRWFGATALSLSAVWLSRGAIAAAAVVAGGLLATPALAQQQPTPPEHYTLDAQGVDLVSGGFTYVATDVVIGQPGQGGITHGRVYTNGGWRDILSGTVAVSGATYVVSLGAESEAFTLSGSTFTPVSNTGATLTQTAGLLTFTTSNGTVAEYSTTYGSHTMGYAANYAALVSVQQPNGDLMTFNWAGITYCVLMDVDGEECLQFRNATRLNSVSNNRGYQVNFTYASNDVPVFPHSPIQEWLRRTGAIGVNLAVDYCSPQAWGCTGLTRTWPSVEYDTTGSYGGTINSVTDQSGRTTTYGYAGTTLLNSVRLPGSTSDDVSIAYAAGQVSGVTDASGAWTYAYTDVGTQRTAVATGPLSQQLTVVSSLTTGRATSITNGLSETVAYLYDSQLRVTRATQPEGDYARIGYDSRGNVTSTTYHPKPGSPLAELVTSATYPSACANPVICNQPTTTTDARGAVTNYTYDASHGGVQTITQPAPTSGAVRPQTRITYASYSAWYKNSFGTIVQAPTPVTLPAQVSRCVTGASCLDTSNEVRTTVAYGASGVANNLLPTAATSGSGDGLVQATTTTAYTPDGDLASVDGPLSGTTDTTTYRYDDARRPVGVIGPDPDGGGALLRRAQRNTYDPAGRLTLAEQGTVTGLTDPNWAAFATLQQSAIAYDGFGRPTHQRLQAGGVTYALEQSSYDAAGRVACSATRMNPTAFAGPPASACDPSSAGSFGPDRIALHGYDAAGRPNLVVRANGTAATASESATYTDNGKAETLVDGNGNRSTLEYDGFDRLSKMRYPEAANGSVSSTTDFMQYGYDENGNVVSTRTRNAQIFATTYDALNRPTLADNPTNVGDVTYSYDLLGRPLTASLAGGRSTTLTWDALNRQLTETDSVLGTTSMRYDLAGRRIRLTWPDTFYVTYDYDLTNAMTAILGNGTAAYTAYAYDNLGRRASITRGNGITTTYGYDPASRLTSLAHNLPGASNDQTLTFTYNPAGQIMTRSGSNAAYDNPAPATGSDSYPINGLNQSGTGGLALPYDLKGNLLGDATQSYTYDQANRLTSHTASGVTATLTWDPLSRLAEMVGAQGARYLYDGQQIAGIATNASPTLINRIVHGPWPDEVVVVYPTSSTPLWNLQDNLGSTIAITTNTGAPTNILAYDENGVPKSTNTGRFQYTGQLWLPDFGVYHYKARAYNPTLGRFLQTDPISYAAGMNLYGYVGGDPVNRTDPPGLDWVPRTCTRTVQVGVTDANSPGGTSWTTQQRSFDCSYWVDDSGDLPSPDETIYQFPGQTVDQLICVAAGVNRSSTRANIGQGVIAKAGALAWWVDIVWPGHAWDFKVHSPNGLSYEGYGNFAYGATGTALGLDSSTILRGAGAAQFLAAGLAFGPAGMLPGHGVARENGMPAGTSPYGDDERDQANIRAGIEYAKEHPCPE